MTRVYDDPADFAASALAGFCDAHAGRVRAVRGGVLRADALADGQVALVVGGGSGHYPAFTGYVGPGLATAAVAGDVFASPSAAAIRHVARLAHRGGGVLLGYGNYAGDVLNFGLAAELLATDGIDARLIAVTDDVASDPEPVRRRGIAGDLAVFKVAGAAVAEGSSLDVVEAVARRANAATRSLGVALRGCTLPGAASPLFSVDEGRFAIGLGIHGEAGIEERPSMAASALAALLVERLLEEVPQGSASRVAAILNGLGGTKGEELFVLWNAISARLRASGLEVVAPVVGEFVTSLDMAGCSLTLCWLDDQLERLWLAPCDAAVMQRRPLAEAALLPPEDAETVLYQRADDDSAIRDGARIAAGIAAIAEAMASAEAELGRLDAIAGDGDHGQGMARGSAAAAEASSQAAAASAGPASVLAAAGEAWAARAGGTSGALWGVGLVAAARTLRDDRALVASDAANATEAALAAIVRLGGARLGDKTLVDSLQPFAQRLSQAIASGDGLNAAWSAAASAARDAAVATSSLSPRLGRARPLAERSKGHPDAGATSLALCLDAIGARIAAGRA